MGFGRTKETAREPRREGKKRKQSNPIVCSSLQRKSGRTKIVVEYAVV